MKRVQIEVQDLTKDDDERIPRDPRRRDARPRSPRGDPRLRGEPAPAVVDPYQEIVEPEASISVEVLSKVKTSKPRRPKRREQARSSRVPGRWPGAEVDAHQTAARDSDHAGTGPGGGSSGCSGSGSGADSRAGAVSGGRCLGVSVSFRARRKLNRES